MFNLYLNCQASKHLLIHLIYTTMNNFNDNQIIAAIESIAQRFISCFHDEANGYAFKYTDGTWGTAKYSFVHDIANDYDKDGKFCQF